MRNTPPTSVSITIHSALSLLYRHSHTHAFTWAARHPYVSGRAYWESLIFYQQDSASSHALRLQRKLSSLRVMHRITWKARLNGIKVN